MIYETILKKILGIFFASFDHTLFSILIVFLSSSPLLAQTLNNQVSGWPDWAYGYLTPLRSGDLVAPECLVTTSKATDCAYKGEVADNIKKNSLPGTELRFTAYESAYNYGPADWYPQDHPEMPDIVANGREEDGLRSCSLCHYPNGQGKMENGHVAGLPYEYIVSQLKLFAIGDRRSADPRKANTNEMSIIAKLLTEEEIKQVAEYYSSISFKPLVKVIESELAPQVRMTTNRLMIPLDKPFMPLDNFIIEVPEYPERTAIMRDPRAGFITYAPIGSLDKGRSLVSTGEGKTIPCNICHGLELKGSGEIPGIVGKTASYIMRQLWDVKLGARKSPEMLPTVINLNEQDLMAISAYLASINP
tara:strand:- start:5898 stop:6983 length:1086 start_codon:yes stop_codon:yes gene_type:complete